MTPGWRPSQPSGPQIWMRSGEAPRRSYHPGQRPDHGRDGWEATRPALCCSFVRSDVSKNRLLEDTTGDTTNGQSALPPSDADKVIA
jgi:hypothetical protein